MKPPKLPGVEKFKFWDKSLLDDDESDLTRNHNTCSNTADSYSVPHSVFIRGHVIRNTCPTLPQKSVFCDIMDSSNGPYSLPTFCRDTRRRKVILPISSRLAAKVLTSTDLPLGLFDIRDYHKSTRLRESSSDVVVGGRCTNLPIRRINCSNSSLHSTDDQELASNLSNASNVSNFSLSSTSTSSCPIISDSDFSKKTII